MQELAELDALLQQWLVGRGGWVRVSGVVDCDVGRVPHVWAECGDAVFDPQLGAVLPKAQYYVDYGAEAFVVL